MSYATLEDMKKRFSEQELIQISDRGGLGVINEEVFAQAQKDGDAEIDAYLQARYPLPLSEVPPNLVRVACDLYRYYMYGNLVPDYAQKRYDQAVSMLKSINKGDIDLTAPGPGEAPPAADVEVSFKPGIANPVFTESRLKNF